jgi:hypothetical protein
LHVRPLFAEAGVTWMLERKILKPSESEAFATSVSEANEGAVDLSITCNTALGPRYEALYVSAQGGNGSLLIDLNCNIITTLGGATKNLPFAIRSIVGNV